MMNLVDLMDQLLYRRSHFLFDDFDTYVDTQLWTKGGSGTVTSVSTVNGAITLTTGAVAAQEAFTATTLADWLIANNKPILYETRINYTEASTNQAILCFGLSGAAFGAGQMQAAAAGPKASFSGAMIYKQQGETVWRCVSSLGSTQTINKSTLAAGGGKDQILRIEIRPSQATSQTLAEVAFFVGDGDASGAATTPWQQLIDSVTGKPIKHFLNYTSALKMQAGVFAKAGAGATSEIVLVDYVGVIQLR